MAETIKGINVVIGAETTGLSKALTDVNKKSRDIQSELRQVEKLLRLDPGNTELLAQKQKLLSDAVSNTSDKLNRLRTVQQQVNEQFARGEISEGQYRAFQREVARTEQELRGLDGMLEETTQTINDQGEAVSQLGQDYKESFDQARQSMGNSFEQMKKVGAGITAAGAGIAAGLGIAVNKAADFEQGMANVYSVMAPDEVTEFREELEALAIQLGADTKYSATEAAVGLEELIKAGVNVQDVLNGGLSGALSLATAGELELGDAAEIASTALNAFKSDAISVQDAADILAGAANASATSVSELKFGLSQSASVASSVGLSFKDTATALAAFAQNGLKGSDAGTSLKTMLMRLQPSTKAQIEEFERLDLMSYDLQKGMEFLERNGIKPLSGSFDDVDAALKQYAATTAGAKLGSEKAQTEYTKLILQTGVLTSRFYDAAGSLRGMDEIAGLLQESFEGMTDAQRQASMQILFGTDAIRAGNILYKEGAEGINNMAEAMGKISAEDVATQKLNTFQGAIEELGGSLETAQISIGKALIPALRALTGFVQKVVDVFNSLPDSLKSFVAIAGAVAAAVALIAGPLLLLIGFLPQIMAGFTALSSVMVGIKALAPVMTALTGPIGLIIAGVSALVAGLTYLYNTNETVRNALTTAWEYIKSVAETVFNATAEVIRYVFDGINAFWDQWGGAITQTFKILWEGTITAVKAYLNIYIQAIKAVFNAIKAFWDKWGDTITATFKNLFEIVKIVFKAAFDLVYTVVKTIFDNLKAFWDRWGDTVTTVFKTVLAVVKSVFEGTWNAIKIVVETVVGVISGIVKTWLSIFKGDWAGAWNNAKSVVTTVWDGIKGLFKNSFETMKNIGKDIIRGLIEGIKDMKDAAVNTAKEVASNVANSVKDFFGIKSPSRLMIGYGDNIVQGLANGMKSNAGSAVRSAAGVASAVAGAMSNISGSVAGVQGAAAAAGGNSTVINMTGMMSGANFYVRNDNDINLIAQQLGSVVEKNMRGLGG